MTNNPVRENNGTATTRRESDKFITPVASINETPDGYTLELEMPGVSKDGLEISVENNELLIVGRKKISVPEATIVHRESRPHDYRRSFEIEPPIDSARISARVSQGIVTLALPKAEEVKPRKIIVA